MTGVPRSEVLRLTLILADRAGRGRLTVDETVALRHGVMALGLEPLRGPVGACPGSGDAGDADGGERLTAGRGDSETGRTT